jgi:hypothetical protein
VRLFRSFAIQLSDGPTRLRPNGMAGVENSIPRSIHVAATGKMGNFTATPVFGLIGEIRGDPMLTVVVASDYLKMTYIVGVLIF